MDTSGKQMNIYIVERNDDERIYDQYVSYVIAAETEQDARTMSPDGYLWNEETQLWAEFGPEVSYNFDWPIRPEQTDVTLIGTTKIYTERQVIHSHYINA